MNGSRKGSQFERGICRKLSLWWTSNERDDVFWRSCQSGGRATQRAKSGKQTFGAYGDIAAVDPIGLPLLQVFTFELKRGRSHGNIGDFIDCPESAKTRPFEETIEQARASAELAGSAEWLLVCQRDRRECMIYGPSLLRFFLERSMGSVRVHGFPRIYFTTFNNFLDEVSPTKLMRFARKWFPSS